MHEAVRHVRNTGTNPLHVLIEPWAEEVDIPPGATYRFVGRAEHNGDWEVELQASSVTLYGWASSMLFIYQGDQLLLDMPVAVPGVPEGSSMSSFVKLMFGSECRMPSQANPPCEIW
jgi:hypothetical protein